MTNPKRKGATRERQARDCYEQAGYQVQPFYGRRYGETDGFSLFDAVAARAGDPVRFIQVKSNRAAGIESWVDAVTPTFHGAHAVADYAVCHDREGWRVLQPAGGGGYTTVFDGRDRNDNMGAGLTDYLSK